MKNVLIFILAVIFMTASFAGTQDVSEATHEIDLDSPLPPIEPGSVKFYTYKPTSNARLVGKIYARGMATVDKPAELDILGRLQEASDPTRATEEDDKNLAMQAIILDAANIGADAVIIVKSYQVRLSAHSSERRMEALAYRTARATAPAQKAPTPPKINLSDPCGLSVQCLMQRSQQ
jgi:hypothetical protein